MSKPDRPALDGMACFGGGAFAGGGGTPTGGGGTDMLSCQVKCWDDLINFFLLIFSSD